jgi:archaellum component FlaC
MKKVIIGLAITLILLTGTPALAVGPDEWKRAVSDIETLKDQCGKNYSEVQDLKLKIERLEKNIDTMQNQVNVLENLFNKLKTILLQVVQMLISIKK